MAGADLLDYQWELGDLVFGVDRQIGHEADATPGTYTWRTRDTPSPIGDATAFGRDLIEPGTWAFKLFTDMHDAASALAVLEQAALQWRGDSVRSTPGEAMPLRYRLAGRTRVVYGRPRRFDAPLDNRLASGYVAITSDFKMASELYFDDIERNIPVLAIAPTTGGFTAPFTTPITTEEQLATRPNQFTVDGVMPTPGIFEFTGPSSDAFIEIDGDMRIQLTGTIPVGITVTVDARPWVMSAYRSDGAGVAGMIHRRTRLPRLLLAPGSHQATYGGYDETGASSARIRWRPAHPSV